MSTGLDTNVLVRFLVKDDPDQANRAAALIRGIAAEGKSCFINHIVLCETVWVLESAYGFSRQEIVGVLEKMLTTRQFDFDLKNLVRQAIRDYRQLRGDLADYLIGRINQAQGCAKTATFDRALRDSPIFDVLEISDHNRPR